ncbi:MATE family efflux transporter [Algoriphagus chordae]|uniref:O-antigen/teichoic acid export membrane protein n=1 Tax=Algoriphagus chordae TaxID=237019 RepID=A0A2W7QTV8_9BACT|nr:polysaccharide biosynthesis protein [Algoriphagus chordae]PZX52088.1 hypothetical protein LV85_02238 [Algoriphagus chordae]
MLGTMIVLSDGGLSTGVTSLMGKVWKDKTKSGIVLASGFKLKNIFSIVSIVIVSPILYYLLVTNGATWFFSVFIIAAMIPAFLSSMSMQLYQIPLLINQEVIPLQKNHLSVNLARVALLACSIFIFPFAFVAVLSNGIPQVWGNFKLKYLSSFFVNSNQKADKEVSVELIKFVKRILPGSIYYCISGQLTIWIISFLGSTDSIAQIGAISRVAMALTIISTVFHTLITPRFIRLKYDKTLIFNRYLQIVVGMVMIASLCVAFFWLFSDYVLWILGPNYSNLNFELVLFIIGASIDLVVGVLFILNSNRGWLVNPVLNIFIGVMSIVVGVVLFDVSSLVGVLYFKLFVSLIVLVYYFSFGLFKISKIPKLS